MEQYLEVTLHAVETAVHFISYPCIFSLEFFFVNTSLIKIEIERELEPGLNGQTKPERTAERYRWIFTQFQGKFVKVFW